MEIGMVGLGRMGMNMARRLMQGGHRVVVYNRSREKVDLIAGEGAVPSSSISDLVGNLTPPRTVLIMLPAGPVADEHLAKAATFLAQGDLLIDGGNSFYRDDLRRKEQLEALGIHYMDAGISGGIWGLKVGYCTMVGGAREDFDRIEPLLRTLAPENGYLYCGPWGAGHFVKMVHNGIEYAMMESYAEGFEIIENSPYSEHLEYSDVARLWNQGSVIRSWLLELLEEAFEKDPQLDRLRGWVEDSGEGRWTVQQAVDAGVDATVIACSLFKRFNSRKQDQFSNRVLAALRAEFGGHAIRENE
jgi:6-phosphogluconate dehydrogenase